jgi:hypothetical protein
LYSFQLSLAGSWSVYAVAKWTSGGTPHQQQSNTVTITAQNQGFTLTTSTQLIGVTQGSTATLSFTVSSPQPQPYTVTLQAPSGLPSGVTYSYNPGAGSPTFTSTLTLSAEANAQTGTFTVTVTASGGGFSSQTQFTLIVYQQQVTYTFQLLGVSPDPSTLGTAVTLGGSLCPAPQSGISTNVYYARPDGSKVTNAPVHNQQDFCSGFTVDYYTPDAAGQWSVYAEAYANGQRLATSNTLTFTVRNQGFSVSVSQQVGITQGGTGTVTVTVSSPQPQPYTVSLITWGIPSDVQYAFAPQSSSPPFTSTLTLTASPTAQPNSYTVTVTGNGSGYSSSDTFTLDVHPGATKSLSVTLSADKTVLTSGSSTVVTATVTASDGSSPPITYSWTADGGTFSATDANPTTWRSPSQARKGEYTITVTVASSGYTGASASLKIQISQKLASSITIALSPQSVQPGDAVTISGTLQPPISTSITLQITRPDKSLSRFGTSTDSDGGYSYQLTVSDEGTWTVRASWDGSDQYLPAASGEASFTVGHAPVVASSITGYTLTPGIVSRGDTMTFSVTVSNGVYDPATIWVFVIILGPSSNGETFMASAIDGPRTIQGKKSQTIYLPLTLPSNAPYGDYVANAYLFDNDPMGANAKILDLQGRWFSVGGTSFVQMAGSTSNRIIHIHVEGQDVSNLWNIVTQANQICTAGQSPCVTLSQLYIVLKASAVIDGGVGDDVSTVSSAYTIPLKSNVGYFDVVIVQQAGTVGRIYASSMPSLIDAAAKDFGEKFGENMLELIGRKVFDVEGVGDIYGIYLAYRDGGAKAALIKIILTTNFWADMIVGLAEILVNEVWISNGLITMSVPSFTNRMLAAAVVCQLQ